MRMRLGLAAGFAAGYLFGTKAGRERYEELQQLLAKVKRSEAYGTAADKAKAAVDLGVERAREVVEEHKPGNGSSPAVDLRAAGTGGAEGTLSGTPGTPPSGTGPAATGTTPTTPEDPGTAIP